MRFLVHYLSDTNITCSYVYIGHNREDCIRFVQEELKQYLGDESFTIQELLKDKTTTDTEFAMVGSYEVAYTNYTLFISNDYEQYSMRIVELGGQFDVISEL